jgi:hypothetical protein
MTKVYTVIDDKFIRKFFNPECSLIREYGDAYKIAEDDLAKIRKYMIEKYDLEKIRENIEKKIKKADCYPEKDEIDKNYNGESEARKKMVIYLKDNHPKNNKRMETFVGVVTVNVISNADYTLSINITQIELTDGMGFQWLLTRDGKRFYDKCNEKSKFLWERQMSKNSPLYKYHKNKNSLGIKKSSPKDEKQLLKEYIASLKERQRKSRYFSFCQLTDPEKVLLQLENGNIGDMFNHLLSVDAKLKKHIYEDSCGNKIGDIFEIAELLEVKLDVEPPSPSKEDNENKKDGETNFYYEEVSFYSRNT